MKSALKKMDKEVISLLIGNDSKLIETNTQVTNQDSKLSPKFYSMENQQAT